MAVRFDAAGEQYSATNGLPGDVYTLTAWVWPAAVGVRFRAVYWLRTFSDQLSGVVIRDFTSELQLIDNGSYGFNGVGPLVATPETWYRIGVVVNGANATFHRSAAGSPLGSASVDNFSPPATPNEWWIGDDPYDDWWDGRIAALKVWGAALTAGEVEAELAQYMPRRTSGLLRFHPFVRAETVDYSGNNNALSAGTGVTTEDGPPIPWASATPLIVLPPASGTAVTGTVAATLPAFTSQTAGVVRVSANLSARLPALTSTAAGAAESAGDLLGVLPGFDADATGTVEVAGTATAALPALTATVAGAVTLTGTADAALPPLTADIEGHATVAGASEGVLPALAASLSGQIEATTGTLAGTLPPLAAQSAATVTVTGTAAASLPALNGVLAAQAAIAGAMTGGLPAINGILAAEVSVAGVATGGLPSITASLTGQTLTGQGQLAGTLPALAAHLSGTSEATDLDIEGQAGPPAVGYAVGAPYVAWNVGNPTL